MSEPNNEPLIDASVATSMTLGSENAAAPAEPPAGDDPNPAQATITETAAGAHRSAQALHVLIDEMEKRLFPDAKAYAGAIAAEIPPALHDAIDEARLIADEAGARLLALLKRL